MGNVTSNIENTSTDPDPWWNPNQPQNNQNESQQTSSVESEITSSVSHEIIRSQEDTKSLHEMWYQREQTLGQTIQHLAEENMRLSSARRSAEKRLQEYEAETQNTSEELDKLRSEAEKAQQVFEKLHAQIQSGREDRQMITSEMERIRSGFDVEREAKEQLLSEMSILREQRDENKRTVEFLNEKLKQQTMLVEKSMASFNQERREKECLMNELEKLKDELKATKNSLASATDSLQTQELTDNSRLLSKESSSSEETACARIRSPEAIAEMVKFQAEMSMRREARQRAMQAVSTEMERLRTELNAEREAREQAMHKLEQTQLQAGKTRKTKQEEALEVELEQAQQKIKSDKKKIKELSQENGRLQFELMNSREALTERSDELEKLQTQLETGRQQMQHQIDALKEVGTICKEMLNIREGQVLHLTEKLRVIEASVTNRVQEKMPVDLKTEYETQMENIRSLKALYEERMKLMLSEKEKLVQESEEKSQRLDAEIKKSAEFEQKLADTKLSLEEKEEENCNLQIQLDDSHDKSHGLAKELSLINNLFTQMLIGSSATEMDLDRLTRLLQENHDLITDITIKEDSSEIAAVLPKLILDLVNQADSGTASTASTPTEERNEDTHGEEGVGSEPETRNDASVESSGSQNKTSTEESVNGMAVHDIALNLPKVWKVLLELLSHHIAPNASEDQEEKQNSCYKSIDTPSGPRLVVSVSQTFLHLKDLILEKKSLQKELSRLKQLNGHLERKLNGQEQKLSVVSTELRKTWNVVDQMQTQHQKLHTHEKILRYELHEKRKMLTELKQELEYCREKWESARQKNSESEVEWKKLRKEFALRKKHPNDVLNNSGESGFLDERGDDSCEDDDTSAKDTGQIDPGIEDISGSEDIRTSSPIETGFSESNSLMDSSRMHTSSPLHNQDLLNQSQSELILDLESDALTNTVSSELQNNEHQTTFPPESSKHASDLCLSSFDALQNGNEQNNLTDCNINLPYYNNCSTISVITLLKQQLAFFSRNLDYISISDNDMSSQNLEALESIFSLPPIQIPKAVNDKITIQNCFQNYSANSYEQEDVNDFNDYSVPSTSTVHNSTFDSRETENRISEDRSAANSISIHETAGTVLNTSDDNTKLPILSASTPHNLTFDSRETENRISDERSINTRTEVSEVQDQSVNRHLPVLESSDACQTQSSKESTRANRTPEEIAEARAARLKRLEEQCQQLYNKVTKTTHRSTALCNRLEELHEQFRGSESPPGVRNDTTQSSESDIPVSPSIPSSSRNPTASVLRSATSTPACTSSKSSETKNIPPPPPLPRKLPARRIATNIKSLQNETSITQIPSPPPIPHTLPSEQMSTCIQTVQATNGIVIPIPPPFPQSLRGRRLPTCMSEITNNTPDSQYSTDHCANESTTRQNDVQGQEELPQETNTAKFSTDVNNETNDNGEH